MRIPEEVRSHDVLEPLDNGTVSDPPSLRAVQEWRHMSHYDCLPAIILQLCELPLKPAELIGGVVSCFQYSEIGDTACQSVDSDELGVPRQPPVVFNHELTGIVSKFAVGSRRIITYQVHPVIGQGPKALDLIRM